MTTDRRIKRICPFHLRFGNIRFILKSVVIFPVLPKIRYNQKSSSIIFQTPTKSGMKPVCP